MTEETNTLPTTVFEYAMPKKTSFTVQGNIESDIILGSIKLSRIAYFILGAYTDFVSRYELPYQRKVGNRILDHFKNTKQPLKSSEVEFKEVCHSIKRYMGFHRIVDISFFEIEDNQIECDIYISDELHSVDHQVSQIWEERFSIHI
jgi:hypothetical protein